MSGVARHRPAMQKQGWSGWVNSHLCLRFGFGWPGGGSAGVVNS
jgi:hypothetical protein